MAPEDDEMYDRRQSDRRLDVLEDNWDRKFHVRFDEWKQVWDSHIETHHGNLTPEQIKAKIVEHDANEVKVTAIIDAVDGTPIVDLQTGRITGRNSDGMRHVQNQILADVGEIKDRTNGGVTVTYKQKREWTRGEKIAASSVGVAAFFAALPGLLGFIQWAADVIAQSP